MADPSARARRPDGRGARVSWGIGLGLAVAIVGLVVIAALNSRPVPLGEAERIRAYGSTAEVDVAVVAVERAAAGDIVERPLFGAEPDTRPVYVVRYRIERVAGADLPGPEAFSTYRWRWIGQDGSPHVPLFRPEVAGCVEYGAAAAARLSSTGAVDVCWAVRVDDGPPTQIHLQERRTGRRSFVPVFSRWDVTRPAEPAASSEPANHW